jgi:hypothetical protein
VTAGSPSAARGCRPPRRRRAVPRRQSPPAPRRRPPWRRPPALCPAASGAGCPSCRPRRRPAPVRRQRLPPGRTGRCGWRACPLPGSCRVFPSAPAVAGQRFSASLVTRATSWVTASAGSPPSGSTVSWRPARQVPAPAPGQHHGRRRPPQPIRAPRLSAYRAASASMVVLPMPASPASSSTWPRPTAASSTLRRSWATTSSLPTGPAAAAATRFRWPAGRAACLLATAGVKRRASGAAGCVAGASRPGWGQPGWEPGGWRRSASQASTRSR